MRIISGKYKNMQVLNYKNNEIRPTMDRAKEGLFNIINYEIIDKSFLDLFAGSGNVGIEALSRGASNVVFVDRNSNATKLIKQNLQKVDEECEVICLDALSYINRTTSSFDYIFIDPPYNIEIDKLTEIINNVIGIISENGYLIIELPYEYEHELQLEKLKTRKYGKTYFTIFKKDKDE